MYWKIKALIAKVCGFIPFGDMVYVFLQRKFGRLDASPFTRIDQAVELVKCINEINVTVQNKTVMEVGTGHQPLIPIYLFLMGAKKIVTFDLNTRLSLPLLSETLRWMIKDWHRIDTALSPFIDKNTLGLRKKIIEANISSPKNFLIEANIEYIAPGDAAKTNFPDKSIDYHISVTVLEHISSDFLRPIFEEAKRILKPDGCAIHFIDMSDHFQHQDSSISALNFLRFNDRQWHWWAGNEFSYTNRMRSADFITLFSEIGFKIIKSSATSSVSDAPLPFTEHMDFSQYTPEELRHTELNIAMRTK